MPNDLAMKGAAALIGGAAALGGSAISARAGRKSQKEAAALSQQQASTQLDFQREQMALLEEQKQRYRDFEFTNPYANMQNQYQGMENVYEDLTVNQQAARFQMEQGAQQRANILQTMQGAAGATGIASLAQAMAGQGIMQARQVSTDIARQEQANQLAAAKGAQAVDLAQRKGAQAVDLAQRQGAQMLQEAEMQRQATLLGMQFQGAAGANTALQQAQQNQMAMQQAGIQMQMQNAQAFANMGATAMGSLGSIYE